MSEIEPDYRQEITYFRGRVQIYCLNTRKVVHTLEEENIFTHPNQSIQEAIRLHIKSGVYTGRYFAAHRKNCPEQNHVRFHQISVNVIIPNEQINEIVKLGSEKKW